jgi:ribosomal-protein-alanine N-acetyltransferase
MPTTPIRWHPFIYSIRKSMPDRLPYIVEAMTLSDIDQVMAIEKSAFSVPWSARAYRFEVSENAHSVMLVVRHAARHSLWKVRWLQHTQPVRAEPVLGYAGLWLLGEDAHVATIAVHPEWRGQGLGELLLLSLLEAGMERSADRATLEVRVSNQVAQRLYEKYGFQRVSRRRHYYADNNEDAYIMATPYFPTAWFQARLKEHRVQLYARLRESQTDQAARQRQEHSAAPDDAPDPGGPSTIEGPG